jgi:cytochrome c
MPKRRLVLTLILGLLLLVVLSGVVFSQQWSLERGRAIAERECALCHAVGQAGASLHLKAPPFRELPKRYPVEHLAESLVEGIVVGHGDMPEFLFEPDDVEALLAYIASLAK